jgi:hypothetical protein
MQYHGLRENILTSSSNFFTVSLSSLKLLRSSSIDFLAYATSACSTASKHGDMQQFGVYNSCLQITNHIVVLPIIANVNR